MAENIKLGWLEDYDEVKFAPKTFSEQILNADGTSYEVSVQNKIDAINAQISNMQGGTTIVNAANKLNVADTGDTDTPIYFKDGVPIVCTSLDLDTSGNAATATAWKEIRSFSIEDYSGVNSGSPIQVDGTADTILLLPKTIEAETFMGDLNGNAATADKINSSLSINGKTFDGSTAVDVDIIGTTYGGTGNATGRVQIGQKAGEELGINATSEGEYTTASGNYSHAEGYFTTASEEYSHSEGLYTTASGNCSHAEGARSIARGTGSHAEGNSFADGNNSHAEGSSSIHLVNLTGSNGTYVYDTPGVVPGLTLEVDQKIFIDNSIYTIVAINKESSNEITLNDYPIDVQWDNKEGYLVNFGAFGSYSHAEGNNTNASGDSAHSEGDNTIASGNYSHAEGYSSAAYGEASHAEGRSIAQGDYSHSEGKLSCALGQNSHVEGLATVASGEGAHAEGACHANFITDLQNYNRENGTSITIESDDADLILAWESQLIQKGSSLAKGVGSHVEGAGGLALGNCAHAEGYGNLVKGYASHAEGYQTQANEDSSHAEGSFAIADGHSSHAEGYETQAKGKYSHAQGQSTRATGECSFASGKATIARGQYSVAMGENTLASGKNSCALGQGITQVIYLSGAANATQYILTKQSILSPYSDLPFQKIDSSGSIISSPSPGNHYISTSSGTPPRGTFYNSGDVSYNSVIYKLTPGIKYYFSDNSSFSNQIYLFSSYDGNTLSGKLALPSNGIIDRTDASESIFLAAPVRVLTWGYGYTGYTQVTPSTYTHTYTPRSTGSIVSNITVYTFIEDNTTSLSLPNYIEYNDKLIQAESQSGSSITLSNTLSTIEISNEKCLLISDSAQGDYSFTCGQHNKAIGNRSFAIGLGTIANGSNQMVIGDYNAPDAASVFIIGNGQDAENRSNALKISYNGKIEADSIDLYGAINASSATISNSMTVKDDLTVTNDIDVGGEVRVTHDVIADRVFGAVWNDYAEYRTQKEIIEPGYCVASADSGQIYKTTEKFQACDGIVSDTFGFAIGETNECQTPLAVAGRVLAYCEGDRYDYHAGDTVCAGPEGKVVKMTREEIREWPDRIIGIVSEIPEYKTWGTGNVAVNGRIWIKVK